MRTLTFAVSLMLLAGCLEPYELPPDSGTPVNPKPKGCSPLTCTGCCLGDKCLGGNHNESCGYDSRSCETCEAGYRCEAPGACYPSMPAPVPQSLSTPNEKPREANPRCYAIGGSWVCQ